MLLFNLVWREKSTPQTSNNIYLRCSERETIITTVISFVGNHSQHILRSTVARVGYQHDAGDLGVVLFVGSLW